ncbi:VWD domain-containing protein, partial [Candidatus Marithioploca araucensis]|nr:VWD domain-containing protein [Candidatus Marithioploca araucensis]
MVLTHNLRGFDAVHLASALFLQEQLQQPLPFPTRLDVFSWEIFSALGFIFYETVKPMGTVTCEPDCDALPLDGSGRVTLKSQADTADHGSVDFWASKNGEPQLTHLTGASFSGGEATGTFTGKLEAGTYEVYPRLELDNLNWTSSLPLASPGGKSIGKFTVGGDLSLSPTSVFLSGIVGKSDTQDSALQVKNQGKAQADYVLEWSSQTQNVNLSPMSGILQPQGVDSIAANFSCPAEMGYWVGEVEVRRPGGDIEGTSRVSLYCGCEVDCCGRCCEAGEEPPPCGCPASGRLPPACCEKDTSGSCSNQGGDPHLTTFDRLGYDFQGVGEFILVKSLVPNDTFEVQGRYVPWRGRTDVSVAQAVAVRVGQDRVAYYNGIYPPLRINGVPTKLVDGETISLPSGGTVIRGGSTYRVSATDGSLVDVRGTSNMFIGIRVPASKYGKIQGLFGNADQNRENDVAMPDGTVLGTNLAFETLYPKYADSWRITQGKSLFDYEPGETTETFTDRNFPRLRATVEDLPANIRANAEAICQAAGITDPVLLENCTLDVALTGDESFADIPADAINPDGTVVVALPSLPTINDPGFGQFRGLVRDAITTQVINNGQVSLTVNGNPLPGNNTHSITNGVYQTAVVPTNWGYRLYINADGYIPERVYG